MISHYIISALYVCSNRAPDQEEDTEFGCRLRPHRFGCHCATNDKCFRKRENRYVNFLRATAATIDAGPMLTLEFLGSALTPDRPRLPRGHMAQIRDCTADDATSFHSRAYDFLPHTATAPPSLYASTNFRLRFHTAAGRRTVQRRMTPTK